MAQQKKASYKSRGGNKKHSEKITMNPPGRDQEQPFDEREHGRPNEWRADPDHDIGQFTGAGEPGNQRK